MLLNLTIRDVVLIDSLTLPFQSGFCAFTGETGAGKTILLDSLALALGARSDPNLVRNGAKQLSVSAEFSIKPDSPLSALLKEADIPFNDDGNDIILRRTVNLDGKSKAFINDEPVSVGFLKTVGEKLLEVHGQFATHGLLDSSTHIDVLDAYGKTTSCSDAFTAWQQARTILNNAKDAIAKASAEEDYLRYNFTELDKISPREGEEEELTQKRSLLINWEKLSSALNETYNLLNAGSSSTASSLRQALRHMDKVITASPEKSFTDIKDGLERAEIEVSDVINQIDDIKNNMNFDSQTLEEVEERLFALRELARKHRTTVDGLVSVLADLKEKLSLLDNNDNNLETLIIAEEQAKSTYIKAAEALTSERTKAAERLDSAVMKELPSLKLEKAMFKTTLIKLSEPEWGPNGQDKVYFTVSTNHGTPLGPLNKIASGGELARFMLALKLNLADKDETETLIFDEIDAGMGGATAAAIGARLSRLAQKSQVMVVTHSPQIAACADYHFFVSKSKKEADNVITTAAILSPQEREEEIARMLSGSRITDEARAAAKKLLEV